jgi:hypothetical protein
MFRRAVKLQFNENKFKQVSTRRLWRGMDDIAPATKRIALLMGAGFGFTFIKYYRKTPSHRVNYTPHRIGLAKL